MIAGALGGRRLGVGVGVGRGLRVLDRDAVALGEPVDRGVHQARDVVLAGEDAEVRAHGAAEADHGGEVAEDRCGQRAAGVVDHSDRVLGHAVGQHLHDALDVGDEAGGARRRPPGALKTLSPVPTIGRPPSSCSCWPESGSPPRAACTCPAPP